MTSGSARKPQFNPPRRPIDLRDEWRGMSGEKPVHLGKRGNEVPGEVGQGRSADDDEERHPMTDHRVAFIGLVADALVVGEGDPAAAGDLFQPYLVGRVVAKVVSVPLYRQAPGPEYLSELLPEIAIGEKDRCHAARS